MTNALPMLPCQAPPALFGRGSGTPIGTCGSLGEATGFAHSKTGGTIGIGRRVDEIDRKMDRLSRQQDALSDHIQDVAPAVRQLGGRVDEPPEEAIY